MLTIQNSGNLELNQACSICAFYNNFICKNNYILHCSNLFEIEWKIFTFLLSKIDFLHFLIGSPEPTIQWFKDEVELKNRPGLTVATTGGCRTSVFIMKSVESDSGKYKCVASNIAGKATSIAEVKVKRKYNMIV